MIAMILAWVFGLTLVALLVYGLVFQRRRKATDVALFTPETDDRELAERTELQRGQLQALHNGQQLGPGGFGG